ncbi:hypothetical protein [Ornithinicoccus hortensis]|uniref:Uncharacterized protein n=1 Tax=Ornithinicoccus hortensis TaxID=82346 RepID=A0A542YM64_9MICO|nr:hypothetical protein [Ornithinicoccus hortensis]TQL49175.1 hypothetical protein FB467_0240 [Ornithinicoccus hortensis]
MPSLKHPGVVIASAVLLLLALGLPWSASTLQHIPGWYSPGFCTPNFYSGTVDCTAGYFSPGMTLGSGEAHGVHVVARVFLVGALVLIGCALRLRQPVWLSVAGGAVLLGILLTGLAAQGGQLAALAGAALLLYAGLADRERAPRADGRVLP